MGSSVLPACACLFCVAAAADTARGYPTAVVITDGYADMTEEHAEALRAFGPVVELKDVVETCGGG